MSRHDNIISRVTGGSREDEKRENFEVSTLTLVLKQLGWTAEQCRHKRDELGAGYNWEWFNADVFEWGEVWSTREFRFNFFDLLEKPSKNHPIIEAYLARPVANEAVDRFMIFQVYDHGRWVATDAVLGRPYLYTGWCNVTPFAGFFNAWKDDQ